MCPITGEEPFSANNTEAVTRTPEPHPTAGCVAIRDDNACLVQGDNRCLNLGYIFQRKISRSQYIRNTRIFIRLWALTRGSLSKFMAKRPPWPPV